MALSLIFEKIILHNFGSYGHTEVDLSARGFCLVSGKNNYKKDNATSNGSGKSFLWSGICFTLTGETIQGLHSNLKNINIEAEDSYTTLQFRNGADEYMVTRYIAPKTDLKIIQNGVDISGKGIRESEKKLGEILPDLTKDLIASTIIIGQSMPNKFSSFSPSGRKDLLEKLTKSDFMIEDIKDRIVRRQAELDRQVRAVEDSLLISGTKLTQDQAALTQLKSDEAGKVKPDFDGQIKEINDKISSYQKDIDSTKVKMKKLEDELPKVSEALIKLTEERTNTSSAEQSSYTTKFQELFKEQTGLESTIRSTQQEITRLKNIKDVCPTCGQKIPGAVKPDTTAQEQQLKDSQVLLESVKTKITDCNNKHTEYQKQISEAFDADVFKLRAQETQLRNSINSYKNSINDFSHYQDLEKANLVKINYEKENWDKARASAATAITKLEETITATLSASKLVENSKLSLLEHQAVTKKMKTLSERDFRGFLLENVIHYIDKKAKEYCKIVFDTEDLKVYLDGNALDISYCDKLIDNLSGGEKQRVDLILQLTIRDLLSTYFNFSSNILVLDEITDNLDKKSCDAVMTLLSTVLKEVESVFIISHHASELSIPIDSEIKVVKNENGISEVL